MDSKLRNNYKCVKRETEEEGDGIIIWGVWLRLDWIVIGNGGNVNVM